ncbi:hypothetical protein HZY97_16105 [Sphingomonas sp. R-74633]|uniref:hypothetical protein n=1 Tax=Sphingomonas sp. R-74633 TaxID=2751188 RepID=UPI0015D34CC0|nr:hypothetical protein [Sphingomonas sp. R-74633]NYT42296.1 hypothetical protein [Sphingomonas sp. R-74633]
MMQPLLFTEPQGSGDVPPGRRQTRAAPAQNGAARVTGRSNRQPEISRQAWPDLQLGFEIGRLPAPRVQNAMWAALAARRQTPPYLNASERDLFERLDAARCARLARMQ